SGPPGLPSGPACRPRGGCWPRSALRADRGGTAADSVCSSRAPCSCPRSGRIGSSLAARPGPRLGACSHLRAGSDRCLGGSIPPGAGGAPIIAFTGTHVQQQRSYLRLGSAPLAGREAELRLLVGLLDQADAGAAQLAALLGEPGVGKTRLLDE